MFNDGIYDFEGLCFSSDNRLIDVPIKILGNWMTVASDCYCRKE
jgi:hypothetical protein